MVADVWLPQVSLNAERASTLASVRDSVLAPILASLVVPRQAGVPSWVLVLVLIVVLVPVRAMAAAVPKDVVGGGGPQG